MLMDSVHFPRDVSRKDVENVKGPLLTRGLEYLGPRLTVSALTPFSFLILNNVPRQTIP